MNISNSNSNAWYHKANENRIKRFERFMKINKLDNALVVNESGEVIDSYSVAILHSDIGFMSCIWLQFCRQLAKAFYCAGSVFLKAGNASNIWSIFCYKLSGGLHFIGSLVCKAGHWG